MGDWRNIDSISHLRERSLSESFPRWCRQQILEKRKYKVGKDHNEGKWKRKNEKNCMYPDGNVHRVHIGSLRSKAGGIGREWVDPLWAWSERKPGSDEGYRRKCWRGLRFLPKSRIDTPRGLRWIWLDWSWVCCRSTGRAQSVSRVYEHHDGHPLRNACERRVNRRNGKS